MPDGSLGYIMPTGEWFYGQIEGRISAQGTSTNYDYNDVVVKVAIKGDYNA